jgi:hypothetical protein
MISIKSVTIVFTAAISIFTSAALNVNQRRSSNGRKTEQRIKLDLAK